MSLDNLFDQAATMARMQAEGYRQVREHARNEALTEAAQLAHMSGNYTIADAINALKTRGA